MTKPFKSWISCAFVLNKGCKQDGKRQKNDQEFVRQLDQIVIDLDANQDMIDPDTYHGLKDKIRRFLDGMEEIKKKGRLLKVGVVGTVKAGKSTF